MVPQEFNRSPEDTASYIIIKITHPSRRILDGDEYLRTTRGAHTTQFVDLDGYIYIYLAKMFPLGASVGAHTPPVLENTDNFFRGGGGGLYCYTETSVLKWDPGQIWGSVVPLNPVCLNIVAYNALSISGFVENDVETLPRYPVAPLRLLTPFSRLDGELVGPAAHHTMWWCACLHETFCGDGLRPANTV